jgi:hypothetical protein
MVVIEQVAFLEILTFIAGALLFVGIGSFLSFLLRTQHPNEGSIPMSRVKSLLEVLGGVLTPASMSWRLSSYFSKQKQYRSSRGQQYGQTRHSMGPQKDYGPIIQRCQLPY